MGRLDADYDYNHGIDYQGNPNWVEVRFGHYRGRPDEGATAATGITLADSSLHDRRVKLLTT